MHIAVALLRLSEGLDQSAIVGDVEDQKQKMTIPGNQSFSQLSQGTVLQRKILFRDARSIGNVTEFFYQRAALPTSRCPVVRHREDHGS